MVGSVSQSLLRVWDVNTGNALCDLKHDDVWYSSFSEDGSQIFSGSIPDSEEHDSDSENSAVIKVWDSKTGKLEKPFDEISIGNVKGHGICQVKCSGKRVFIIPGTGKNVRLWDLETASLVKTFLKDDDTNYFDAFFASADGKILVARGELTPSAGEARRKSRNNCDLPAHAYIWDVKSGERLYKLDIEFCGNHQSSVITKDNQFAILSGDDDGLKIFNMDRGEWH